MTLCQYGTKNHFQYHKAPVAIKSQTKAKVAKLQSASFHFLNAASTTAVSRKSKGKTTYTAPTTSSENRFGTHGRNRPA